MPPSVNNETYTSYINMVGISFRLDVHCTAWDGPVLNILVNNTLVDFHVM